MSFMYQSESRGVVELTDCGMPLARLCFLRPPPAWIDFGSQGSVELELMVSVMDDYGKHWRIGSLDLQLEVQMCRPGTQDWQGIKRAALEVPSHPSALSKSCRASTSCALFTLDSSNTPYHKLKVILTIPPFVRPLSGGVRFKLSGVGDPAVYHDPLHMDLRALRDMLDIKEFPYPETDDLMFLAIASGTVQLRPSKSNGSLPSRVSTEKVQTAYRSIHLDGHSDPIQILERAGLNNSTGQRLWDCAIGLSFFLSCYPKFLFPPSSATFVAHKSPASATRPVLQVVELGAGCGLSGLAARRILSSYTSIESEVIFTDIQATVDTTLGENLELNSTGGEEPIAQVLNWGPLSPSDLDRVFSSRTGPFDLTVLGSDILYNPESHSILLESLLALLQPREGSTSQAIIGYKVRTEGDDAFFKLARDAGLEVKMVCDGLIGIEVWRFLCK